LAAIGRRVCESEWDLFVLLGLAPDGPGPDSGEAGESGPVPAPFGRPTAIELVEAVREYLEAGVMEQGERVARYQGRVARNVLSMVERELRLGPAMARAHADRLVALGYPDDRALADAIRAGGCDADAEWAAVGTALAASARDQLLVANPAYLPAANA
jgi:hypothetical protein